MAKAEVLQMKSNRKIRVVIVTESNVLTVERHLKRFVAEIQICVDSGDLLRACPRVVVYFDQNVRYKNSGFLDRKAKVDLFVER